MKKIKLRKHNETYRHLFKPGEIYYYELDELNIHNEVLYSHIVYTTIDKKYRMGFTEYNFNRCFTDIIKDRKEKIQKLSGVIKTNLTI